MSLVTKPDAPHAVSTSTMRILGVDLSVLVLSTGERVIEADSFERLLAVFEKPETAFTEADAVALAKFIKGVE